METCLVIYRLTLVDSCCRLIILPMSTVAGVMSVDGQTVDEWGKFSFSV